MRRELVVWGFCQILRQSGFEDGCQRIWQRPPKFTQNLRWRHEDKLIERPRYARALDLTDDQRAGRCALAIFVSNVLAKRRLGRASLAVPRRFLDESGPELAQVLREHHGNLNRGAAVDVLR
jgi:hypothetical protein